MAVLVGNLCFHHLSPTPHPAQVTVEYITELIHLVNNRVANLTEEESIGAIQAYHANTLHHIRWSVLPLPASIRRTNRPRKDVIHWSSHCVEGDSGHRAMCFVDHQYPTERKA